MKQKILFLTANPKGTTQLALDQECRQITERIRATDHRDLLELITRWAVRPEDLLQHLNEHKPHIVHFSGHGTKTEEIVLLDKDANPKPVPAAALKQLFTTLKDNIRVVILNACFSEPQAAAITEIVDCAIGMQKAIGDKAAIAFAAAFYQAIGFGRSVKVAFESGKTALMLAGIPEEETPQLLCKKGVNPDTVFLIQAGVINGVREESHDAPQLGTKHTGRIHDQKLFREFQAVFPFEPCVRLLQVHDFGGPFHKSTIQPLCDFYATWDQPEKEFLDHELQAELQRLFRAAEIMANLVMEKTVPIGDQNYLSVYSDTLRAEGPRPDWVREDGKHLNQEAQRFVPVYLDFVRICKRKLED